MKKVLSIVLFLALLLTFTGCSATQKRVYRQYEKTRNALLESSSIESGIVGTTTLISGEDILNINLESSLNRINLSPDNFNLAMEINLSTNNNSPEYISYYYIDDIMYQEIYDSKFASKLSNDEISKTLSETYIPKVEYEVLESASRQREAGNTKLNMVLDTELYKNDVLEQIIEMLGVTDFGNFEIDVLNAQYNIVIDKENLPVNESVFYTVILSNPDSPEDTINISYDLQVDYESFDTLTEIKVPGGVEEYQFI